MRTASRGVEGRDKVRPGLGQVWPDKLEGSPLGAHGRAKRRRRLNGENPPLSRPITAIHVPAVPPLGRINPSDSALL